jgi:hypothetical protein
VYFKAGIDGINIRAEFSYSDVDSDTNVTIRDSPVSSTIEDAFKSQHK